MIAMLTYNVQTGAACTWLQLELRRDLDRPTFESKGTEYQLCAVELCPFPAYVNPMIFVKSDDSSGSERASYDEYIARKSS